MVSDGLSCYDYLASRTYVTECSYSYAGERFGSALAICLQ